MLQNSCHPFRVGFVHLAAKGGDVIVAGGRIRRIISGNHRKLIYFGLCPSPSIVYRAGSHDFANNNQGKEIDICRNYS